MSLAVLQASVLDIGGGVSVAPSAQITVRTPGDVLAALSAARDGSGTPPGNPFFADANGFFRVYLTPGRYNITVATGSGSQVYNDVVIEADAEAKRNIAATDPAVTNDETQGYSEWSLWANSATSEVFRCIDATEGAAVWVKTTLTIDELGTAALEDVGTDAGNVVQLDGTGKLPAVDGSQLTGVTTGSNVTIATITPATDADVTLTEAQYSADVLVIETGAWLAAREIIVPNESRSWQVFSNSAYAATVKTAAGRGGVVHNRGISTVTCDGTNTFVSNPYDNLLKADKYSVCIIKTAGGTASIKAGTIFNGVSFAVNTAITMPALTAGEDYSVWVHPDGTASAVADPYSAPAVAPVVGARKIGGFHYSLTAPGTTPAGGSFATTGFTTSGGNYIWDQAKVDRIAGINEFSIWDLLWHCKGEQRGMEFDPEMQQWMAAYWCGTNHIINGPSRYNTDVASGTVLPKIPLAYGGDGTAAYGRFSQYEAEELANSHGLRLPSIELFRSATFGVTEAQSLGGAAATIPATAREPGYTSRIGIEQATGHHMAFLVGNSAAGGSGWITGPNRGQAYGNAWILLGGGNRAGGPSSGSRCSNSSSAAWISGWYIGLRVAGDHVIGE